MNKRPKQPLVEERSSYEGNLEITTDKRFDQKGRRWHFVRRDFHDTAIPYEDRSVELYFRDDERKEFGLLRFERRKDIPFQNYEVMINKVMNDREFRASLVAPETKVVWNRNWK